MHRRRFLTLSAPALCIGATGCASGYDQRTGLALSTLELENLTDETAVFDVEIIDEAETQVFAAQESVSGESAVVIDQPVADPGQYTVTIRTNEETLVQDLSLFAEPGDACVIAVARLDEAERLRIEGTGYEDCKG